MDGTTFAQEAALRVIEGVSVGAATYACFRPAVVRALGYLSAWATREKLTEQELRAGVASEETEVPAAPTTILRVIEGAKGGPA